MKKTLYAHLNVNEFKRSVHITVSCPRPQHNFTAKPPETLHKSCWIIKLRKYEISQMIDSWYLGEMAHSHE